MINKITDKLELKKIIILASSMVISLSSLNAFAQKDDDANCDTGNPVCQHGNSGGGGGTNDPNNVPDDEDNDDDTPAEKPKPVPAPKPTPNPYLPGNMPLGSIGYHPDPHIPTPKPQDGLLLELTDIVKDSQRELDDVNCDGISDAIAVDAQKGKIIISITVPGGVYTTKTYTLSYNSQLYDVAKLGFFDKGCTPDFYLRAKNGSNDQLWLMNAGNGNLGVKAKVSIKSPFPASATFTQ